MLCRTKNCLPEEFPFGQEKEESDMAKIIEPKKYVRFTEYGLCFRSKETDEVHFKFPLLNGSNSTPVPCRYRNKKLKACSEDQCSWWKTYQVVKERKDLYPCEEVSPIVYMEPAHAICECGKEILLNRDGEACPYCSRLHNLFGQELLPRECWQEEY